MTRQSAFFLAAVALAALAGFVDAIAWIHLAGFFASFMSGNTTQFGIGVMTGDWASARTAGALVLMFLSGVIAASVVAHRFAARQELAVMLLVTAALATGAGAAANSLATAALLLLAFAMGAENGVFGRDGPAVGLTYMTGTLVKMGQRLATALMGAPGDRDWGSLAVLWSGFLVGGLLGAVASRDGLASAVAVAAAGAGVLTAGFAVMGRRGAA